MNKTEVGFVVWLIGMVLWICVCILAPSTVITFYQSVPGFLTMIAMFIWAFGAGIIEGAKR